MVIVLFTEKNVEHLEGNCSRFASHPSKVEEKVPAKVQVGMDLKKYRNKAAMKECKKTTLHLQKYTADVR